MNINATRHASTHPMIKLYMESFSNISGTFTGKYDHEMYGIERT